MANMNCTQATKEKFEALKGTKEWTTFLAEFVESAVMADPAAVKLAKSAAAISGQSLYEVVSKGIEMYAKSVETRAENASKSTGHARLNAWLESYDGDYILTESFVAREAGGNRQSIRQFFNLPHVVKYIDNQCKKHGVKNEKREISKHNAAVKKSQQ